MIKRLLMMSMCAAGVAVADGIYKDGWVDFNKNGTMDVYENPKADVDARVADLLGQMTIEEKTCQMCTLYGYQRVLADELPTPEWKEKVWKDGIAAIDEHLNGFRNWGLPAQTSEWCWPASKHAEAINMVQKWFVEETRLGIPVDFTNEGIRGIESFKATNFPTQLGIGHTWNRKLVRKIGGITGKEAKALGYTNVYAPILDVGRDQRWGRYEEVYGESPFLVAQLGIQMARGIQEDGGVASTAKHYCLYSNNKGAREGYSRCDPQFAPREGENIHMYPFREVIREAGILGVMSSYNDYDGVPIQGSHYWLTERLRGEFGFKGYVVSDSGAVTYLSDKHCTAKDYKESVEQSVMAGLNVRCTFRSPESYIMPLRELVAEGKVPMEQIDRMVTDVLYVKMKVGMFDQPYVDAEAADALVYNEENRKVSLQTARESIVLLKNQNNTLPLKREKIKKLAVIGPNADDSRYATTHYGPQMVDVTTALVGIKELVGDDMEVLYAKGCRTRDRRWPETEILPEPLTAEEQAGIDEAVEVAKQADQVIMVVGGNVDTCGENSSRTSLHLPGHQRALLQAVHKAGKPMVVVVISGRPLGINWCVKHVPAIVQSFYPGSEGGQALAEVLFGEVNPSAKLTVTIPKSAGQLLLNFPSKPAAQYPDGSAGINGSLYNFGHGMSYTKFSYSDLKIEPLAIKPDQPVNVSFAVENIGERAGTEVVQLYTHDMVSTVTTYEKNLRGFERVDLKPGEKKTVEFTIRPMDLELINRDWKRVVESGEFKVMAAAASDDVRLDGIFAVADNEEELQAEQTRIAKINELRAQNNFRMNKIRPLIKATDSNDNLYNLFDGKMGTRWYSGKRGVEIFVKLPAGVAPDQIQIKWYKGDERKYDFEVRYDSGGGQWMRSFKGESSGTTNELETYTFPKIDSRELKLTFNGSDENQYSTMYEIVIPGL